MTTRLKRSVARSGAGKFEKRKAKEMKRNIENKNFEFYADGDEWYFQFTVEDGLYKGQKYAISMSLVYGKNKNINTYPIQAPNCKFLTPIWHPNVGVTGTICLDTLKDRWSMAMNTASIISSLKLLLLSPNPDSPMNGVAARMNQAETAEYIKANYDYNDTPKHIRQLFEKK